MTVETNTINTINTPKVRSILDSFLQTLVFDFEEYAYQNDVVIDRLRKTRLAFNDGTDHYTSRNTIVIGTGSDLINAQVAPMISLRRTQGIIAKELAHMLYTESKVYSKFIDSSSTNYKKSAYVAKHVFNVLETMRVEHRFSEDNNYYKKIFFMKRYPIVSKMIQSWNADETRSSTNNPETIVKRSIDAFSIISFTNKAIFSNDRKINSIVLSLYPLIKKARTAADTEEVAVIADKVLRFFDRLDLPFDGDKDLSPEAKEDVQKPNSRLGSNGAVGNSNVSSNGAPEPQDITSANESEPDPVSGDDLQDALEQENNDQLNELEQEAIDSQLINDFLYGEPSEAEAQEKEREEKKIQDLSEVVPAIHKNMKLKINSRFHRYHKDDYKDIVQNLSGPINQLVTKLSELVQLKIDDYEYNQNSGMIDTGSLSRFIAFNDTDVFKKEHLEEENLSMDVMVLVDCSGSNIAGVMNKRTNTRLERYKVNQMMTIYLHEALKRLNFHHSIWGFDSSGTENISPMVSFVDCFDHKSGLNLKDIGARSANRDGYHIRLAGQHLANHAKSNRKLLIVISDGQPNSNGYSGAPAMKDIVDTQEELKKLGVVTAGIFTGDESENGYFRDMYEKAYFLNNENIFEFDKELFKLISSEFDTDDNDY